jgi:hypothetical protein
MASGTHADVVRLTDVDYDLLREATATEREDLVVRLCGEVGLRAVEVPRVRPMDLTDHEGTSGGRFLTVREDGSDGESTRAAFVPPEVARDLATYVRRNDVEPTAPIVGVSPRRIQMLVKDVGARAADRNDDPRLAGVTPGQLRRLFARRLLLANGVDPNVVFAVGGWERLDSLLPEPEVPGKQSIVDAFGILRDDRVGTGSRLRDVVGTISDVGGVVEEAGTATAITEDAVACLAESDPYAGAWFTRRAHHREGIAITTHAGPDLDRGARVELETLVREALDATSLLVAPVEGDAFGGGTAQLAAVPVTDGETDHGALVVCTLDMAGFDGPEREALRDLGRRLGFAITAVKHRRLLSEETVLRLAVFYDDRTAVFPSLSSALGCTVDLEGVVPAENGDIVTFVRVEGAEPGTILGHVVDDDLTADARLIRSYEAEALVEVVLEEQSPIGVFHGHGGKVVDLTVEDGRAHLVGEFAPGLDIRAVIEDFADDYPSVELHSKQEGASPTESGLAVKHALEEHLTDKQQSVLSGAYHAGYFEWPRGSTAEELADSMGVSSPTLHNHLRRAQQKLIGTALDEE